MNAIDLENDFRVVGNASDGETAVSLALDLKPDVIIMDLNLPQKSGIDAIHEIMDVTPGTHIMTLTSSIKEEDVINAVRARVMGYLTKDVSQDILIKGLREIAAGNLFLPEEITNKLINSIRLQNVDTQPQTEACEKLTFREQEILDLLGEGLSNQSIAQKLFLSNSTVRVHVYNILNKLGLEDRNQAIVYALRRNK